MKDTPSKINDIPTRIATNNGFAIENAAKNIVIIPIIKINREITFACVPGAEIKPAIPINISTNAIK